MIRAKTLNLILAEINKLKKPFAIMVVGLPLVGKSYLAIKIAKNLKLVHLRTDKIRRELFPQKEKRYSKIASEITYKKMEELAQENLKKGKSVILNATFLYTQGRNVFYKLFKKMGINFFVIYVVANDSIVRERFKKQIKRIDFSEADLEVYERMKKSLKKNLNYSSPLKDKGIKLIIYDSGKDKIILK